MCISNIVNVALSLISLIILSSNADGRASIRVNDSLLNSLGAIRIDRLDDLNSSSDGNSFGNFDIRFQVLWPSSITASDVAAVGSSALEWVHFDSKHRATDDNTEPKESADDTDSAKSRTGGFAFGGGVGVAIIIITVIIITVVIGGVVLITVYRSS